MKGKSLYSIVLLVFCCLISIQAAYSQGIKISKDFESALYKDYEVKGNTVTFLNWDPLAGSAHRNLNFRVTGVKGKTVTFIIKDVIGEPFNNDYHRFAVSYDNFETFLYADNGKFDKVKHGRII
jgi:hypothetical protein